jgi:hypothetical protein
MVLGVSHEADPFYLGHLECFLTVMECPTHLGNFRQTDCETGGTFPAEAGVVTSMVAAGLLMKGYDDRQEGQLVLCKHTSVVTCYIEACHAILKARLAG